MGASENWLVLPVVHQCPDFFSPEDGSRLMLVTDFPDAYCFDKFCDMVLNIWNWIVCHSWQCENGHCKALCVKQFCGFVGLPVCWSAVLFKSWLLFLNINDRLSLVSISIAFNLEEKSKQVELMLKLVCIYCILPFSSGKCFILLELICLTINFS